MPGYVRACRECRDCVAASGMATGGRVLHHLIAFARDPRNMILLSGFQAGGTRGAALARGDASVRIYGEDVPIRAEVVQLGSASAHADELLGWLRTAPTPPRRVFITHGEPDAADALRLRIERVAALARAHSGIPGDGGAAVGEPGNL